MKAATGTAVPTTPTKRKEDEAAADTKDDTPIKPKKPKGTPRKATKKDEDLVTELVKEEEQEAI